MPRKKTPPAQPEETPTPAKARRSSLHPAEPDPTFTTEAAPPAKASRRGTRAEAPVEAADPPKARGRSPRPASKKPTPESEPAPIDPQPAAKRGRRGSKDEDDLPVPIWRPIAARAASEGGSERSGSRRSRRGRGRSESEPVAEIPAAEVPIVEERQGRGRGRGKPAREAAAHEETELVPTFRASRGRKGKPDAEARETVAQPEPIPTAPPRPMVPIPADAPQVVVRNGVPVLVRQGTVFPPISFFGSAPDERRAQTVLEEIRLASENGIHIHSHLVELEVDPAAVGGALSLAGYMLRKTLEVDPQAQVLFRVVFVAPNGWADRFPQAAFADESGRLADPSLCDDEYWRVAEDCLRDFVRTLRLLDERDHILGLHLERGEWFFADGAGYDTSKAAVVQFREWARTRYLNDFVALRAAWFDATADFDNLQIPVYRHPAKDGEKFVRSSRKERRWVDYHLFLSDSTVARIGQMAYAAKEASEGYFLVGVSYGYTFEWSHPSSGHLSLGKLLRTREVDFIAGPPSYRSREPGGAAPFPSPIDSYALNGKLYISEEDFKTAIGEWKEPDDFNPVIRTPQALESVHWRGAGSALAHATGISWMDLWGNGWLKTSTIWQRGTSVREALTWRLGTPLSDPDVAVFIDERALAYLVDQNSFALLVQNVRESVLRAGVTAGFYLLSDLTHREKFPESRLYIFLNAWDVRSDLRAAIKNRLQRDGKVLFWLYAAGLFDSGRESLERAREVTGVALKPQPFHSRAGTTILNRKHPLCEAFPDRATIGGANLDPTYFAIPEDALVLGEYTQTGLPSFVIREFTGSVAERWTSVFMGEPVVTPALVRALGQLAGAHIWNYQDDVVHVRSPFLTVHCRGTGPRAITLPEKWSAYSLTSGEWVAEDSASLRFNALDGATHVFLVGRRTEIERILNQDPAELLKMGEIPPREDDTVHFDAAAFDVPIVKLGEWMEGGTLDDVSEDWLLHPKVSDFESEEEEESSDEPERVGRRRRKRRVRNGDRGGDRGGRTSTAVADDVEMHVLFRKRE